MSAGTTVKLSTGFEIPQVGYGTWQSKPGEVGQGIYEALKTGYRHLDLAKVYENQPEVAQGIKRAFAEIPGLKREDIFITSKLWCNSARPENVEKALDETLRELQLDYLDLYLIHWPVAFAAGDDLYPPAPNGDVLLDKGVSISQTWKAVTELPKSKVRSVGVSNFSIEHLETIIKEVGVVPAVNQIERHPRLPNFPLIDYCREKDIHITAYSAFGNNSYGIPLQITLPEVKAIAERLSAKEGRPVTPAQVIVAWSIVGEHSVIPKSVTPSRIAENFVSVDLDEEALTELAKLAAEPRRNNIPFNYKPHWDINIFNDEVDKTGSPVVLVL